ncbi:hypothetical protein [Actinomadura violacea]|uniref:Mce-associated membrane protein n=1 Tax=Actinomadura violacea TaxID=2819934 RepID=A0ABS3RU00_9ACTN|nr:hypothetical protein [Actinomadura violacea]MBO2460116.1 hypothetical protein [Actinomadura violacea]
MTMLGRGKRSAPEKGKGPRKGDAAGKDGGAGKEGEGRTKTAAEQAAKAEEAAEAARLAEEAAERAREAARLAQIAADAAAAVDEAEDAEDTDDDGEDAPAKAKSAVKSPVKPRRTKKAPESEPEADEPAADDSAPAEVSDADVDEVETGAKPEIDVDAEDDSEEGAEAEDGAEDDADDAEDEDDADEPEAKRGKRPSLKKTAKVVAVDEDEDDDEPGRRFGTGRFTLLAVLVVLVLGFGTAAVMLILKDQKQSATDDARKNGLWAASKAAQELSSYDFRTIDTDTRAAAAMTTGKLHDDYVKQIPSFKQQAVAQQLVGTTTVMKTGAISASPDKVVALVYADRSSATKNDKTQQLPESLRLKMTMVKVHGKWLAQKVDVIS